MVCSISRTGSSVAVRESDARLISGNSAARHRAAAPPPEPTPAPPPATAAAPSRPCNGSTSVRSDTSSSRDNCWASWLVLIESRPVGQRSVARRHVDGRGRGAFQPLQLGGQKGLLRLGRLAAQRPRRRVVVVGLYVAEDLENVALGDPVRLGEFEPVGQVAGLDRGVLRDPRHRLDLVVGRGSRRPSAAATSSPGSSPSPAGWWCWPRRTDSRPGGDSSAPLAADWNWPSRSSIRVAMRIRGQHAADRLARAADRVDHLVDGQVLGVQPRRRPPRRCRGSPAPALVAPFSAVSVSAPRPKPVMSVATLRVETRSPASFWACCACIRFSRAD